MTRPLLSVVIPTYNGRTFLESCLASIARHRPEGDAVEVIVSDDGSTDDTVSWTNSAYPEVRVLARPVNGGFVAAANAGIAAARGEFVQLLNNDAEVTAGWVEAGLAPFVDPTVGSVAPLVLVRADPSRVDSAGDNYALVGWPSKRGHGQPAAALGRSTRRPRLRRERIERVLPRLRARARRRVRTVVRFLLRRRRPRLSPALGGLFVPVRATVPHLARGLRELRPRPSRIATPDVAQRRDSLLEQSPRALAHHGGDPPSHVHYRSGRLATRAAGSVRSCSASSTRFATLPLDRPPPLPCRPRSFRRRRTSFSDASRPSWRRPQPSPTAAGSVGATNTRNERKRIGSHRRLGYSRSSHPG